jgi:uncharacterized protein (TIGR02145 family)
VKIQLFLISIFCALNANAQDYLITFTGTGASTTVSTVKVENLTSGTSLIVNGNDILHLKAIITGVNSIKDDQLSKIKIYPNPMSDNSTLQIYPPVAGEAFISVLDITGKPVARIQSYLENSRQDFNLAGLKTGFYIINVKGNNYQLSEKLLSNGPSGGTIGIEKVNAVIQKREEKAPEKGSKGLPATVDMAYASGDRLKFTGISGNYSIVKIDIPTSDKTITFNFISCTDGDNNNYPVVEIGNQVWMAENLKTTKFNDGTAISLDTDNLEWSALEGTPKYCWYNNDPDTFKDEYGALYNWYVLYSGSDGIKNACPVGWHVPNYTEWTTLIQSATGGMLKETGFTHWLIPNTDASNETGFTALPGGERGPNGTYTGDGISGHWWSSSRDLLDDYRKQTFLILSSGGSVTKIGTKDPFGFSIRCVHGEMTLPTISTSAVSSVTNTSATSGGNIINNGYYDINDKGVIWSTSPNPIPIHNDYEMDGRYNITYIKNISGLVANTTYYVRAYFYTDHYYGPVYGNELVFKTYTGTVNDIDGNTYNTVTIGSQLWMAENLKTTKYNDGTSIPQVTDNTEWAGLSTPGYCWYNNDADANKSAYGALYNWYVLDNASNGGKNVCPALWQVPSDEDLTALTDYLIANGYGYQGAESDIAKALAAVSGWTLSPTSGTPGNDTSYNNFSGFTALPGGFRNIDGTFDKIMNDGYWWSSVDSWYRSMGSDYSKVYRGQWGKNHGFSVRCVHGP